MRRWGQWRDETLMLCAIAATSGWIVLEVVAIWMMLKVGSAFAQSRGR